MLEHSARKPTGLENWKPVAVMACCVIAVGFYLAGRESDKAVTPPEAEPSDQVVHSGADDTTTSTNSIVSSVPGNARRIVSGNYARSPARVLAGRTDLPGLSEEEIKLLHSEQKQDVDRLLGDLDVIAIDSSGEGGPDLTVREVQSLHAQQAYEQQSNSPVDVVIPAADGDSALTVADLKAVHQAQAIAIQANDAPDEIVIADSASGADGLTKSEILGLHERQKLASEEGEMTVVFDYSAPGPWGGGSYMTVQNLRELHDSQAQGSDK